MELYIESRYFRDKHEATDHAALQQKRERTISKDAFSLRYKTGCYLGSVTFADVSAGSLTPVLVSGCVWATGWIKLVFTLSVRYLALMGPFRFLYFLGSSPALTNFTGTDNL